VVRWPANQTCDAASRLAMSRVAIGRKARGRPELLDLLVGVGRRSCTGICKKERHKRTAATLIDRHSGRREPICSGQCAHREDRRIVNSIITVRPAHLSTVGEFFPPKQLSYYREAS
jgi:hypothetical protein